MSKDKAGLICDAYDQTVRTPLIHFYTNITTKFDHFHLILLKKKGKK